MNILKIVIIPLLILLSACTQVNSNAETEITRGKDTLSKIEIAISKINASDTLKEVHNSKLLFKARGTEPGWLAEVFTDKLRLLLNYGKDSVLVSDKFENLESPDGYTYTTAAVIDGKSNKLTVFIENKPCIEEASGEKAERAVTITYGNITYKGCGNFSK